jgi:hypothetical protein
MTKLTPNNIVVRETAVSDRGRAIVIELHPAHLLLRLKGLRDRHFVAYDALLWRVMKNSAERILSERPARGTGVRQLPTSKAVVTSLTLGHSRNVRLVDNSALIGLRHQPGKWKC